MTNDATATSRRFSTRKWLLLPLLPFLPLYVICSLLILVPFFISLYVFAEIQRRRRASRLRKAMRKAGRIVSWTDVESDLASGSGTIIVDLPCAGWNDADVWWTRDSIATAALSEGIPLPKDELNAQNDAGFDARTENPVFDRWCETRYFDISHGTAKLVQCTHWSRDKYKVRSRIEKLRSVHAGLESVCACTWIVRLGGEV